MGYDQQHFHTRICASLLLDLTAGASPRRLIGARREGVTWDPYPTRPLARTRGSSTKCSERNQTCISFVRITSLTSKSFVPSSPASTACLAIVRDSNRMTSCAWSSRDSCTGTSAGHAGAEESGSALPHRAPLQC